MEIEPDEETYKKANTLGVRSPMRQDVINLTSNAYTGSNTPSNVNTAIKSKDDIFEDSACKLEQSKALTESMYSQISEVEGDGRIVKINRDNKKKVKCLICCSRKVSLYKNNFISTSKYNAINFFPKNLFKQFTQMANFYFLTLLCLEMYPPVTDSPGYPDLLLPLAFVVSISMVKDLYEDI